MNKLLIFVLVIMCAQPIFAQKDKGLTIGYLLYSEGKYQSALAKIDEALQVSKGLSDSELSKAHFRRAQCLMKVCAQKADPGEAHRGSCFLNAYDDFKKCLELSKSDFEKKEVERGLHALSFYLMQEGLNYLNVNYNRKDKEQLNEALKRFNACIAISEEGYSIYDFRSQTYLLLSDSISATKDLETGIQKFEANTPSNADAMAAYMYYRLASIEKSKSPKQAVSTLVKGIAQQEKVIAILNEDDPNNTISRALKALDDLKSYRLSIITKQYPINEVLQELELIVSANPKDVKPLIVYAELLTSSDSEKAISMYKKAIELEPDNPNTFYNLGAIYVNRAVKASNNMELDKKARSEQIRVEMQKALPIMESAYNISPSDKNILKALVQITKSLGDEEKLERYSKMLEAN